MIMKASSKSFQHKHSLSQFGSNSKVEAGVSCRPHGEFSSKFYGSKHFKTNGFAMELHLVQHDECLPLCHCMLLLLLTATAPILVPVVSFWSSNLSHVRLEQRSSLRVSESPCFPTPKLHGIALQPCHPCLPRQQRHTHGHRGLEDVGLDGEHQLCDIPVVVRWV